ncbi:MAG: hypothetical protein A3F40_04515 [Chlamydiae bacterium RIFCSPHIGHO2_12_FULL_27_8]|nr:MAG: hypothetical protein A3F40_04515 [Chlamydiae bacterium RIFCSPHIGHO2_12_FULL_27_8]OGN66845.1 MAG: hypothetical protein A2888_00760 [Chlamydiae bacterium RIFCSPLOWO2_01_FULL_28_7]
MKKFIFLLVFCLKLFASEEIEVSLQSKSILSPLYLSNIQNIASNFEDKYLSQIYDVFFFDLNFSGYAKVINDNKKYNTQLFNFNSELAFDKNFWKNENVSFLVKIKASSSYLKIYLYDNKNDLLNEEKIDLSGNINLDRNEIHKLSSKIIELFFNEKSIFDIKILYTLRKDITISKSVSEIFLCDFDGENQKQLTFDNDYHVHPVFIPKKNERSSDFIYVSYQNGQPKIYKKSLFSNEKKPIISLPGNQLLPSICKNFEKIAFICDAAGRPDLFIQNFNNELKAEGKPIQLFSYPRATQASSTFSPDGKKIAFVSDKDGTPRIYSINLEEYSYRKRPDAKLITKKNRHNVTPSWSKDGKKIAFSATTDGVRQIWIYDFELDEELQLTKGSINKENPCWAPNNLHIVFNTENSKESELYIININQKEAVKITKGQHRKRFPVFEPYM